MRMLSRVVAALAFVGASLMFASPAHADDTECTRTIVDRSDGFRLDESQIQDEVAKLQDLGADVRIRTYMDDSEDYWYDKYYELISACPNWSSDGESLNTNLIVIILTPAGNVVNVGPAWYDAISESDMTKIHDIINNQADDTAAIEAGLQETIDQLDGVNPNDAGVIIPLGIALVGGIGGTIGYVSTRRRSRKDAAELARSAYNRVTSYIETLNSNDPNGIYPEGQDLKRRVELLLPQLKGRVLADLQALYQELQEAINDAMTAVGGIDDDTANDPMRDQTIEQYRVIEDLYIAQEPAVARAQDLLDKFKDRCTKLEQLLADAPVHLQKLKDRAAQIVSDASEQKGRGTKRFSATAQEISSAVDGLQSRLASEGAGGVLDSIAHVEQRLDEAEAELASYEEMVEKTPQDLSELARQISHRLGTLSGQYEESEFRRDLEKLESKANELSLQLAVDQPDFEELAQAVARLQSEYDGVVAAIREQEQRERQEEEARLEALRPRREPSYDPPSYDPPRRRDGGGMGGGFGIPAPGRNRGGGGFGFPSPGRKSGGGGGFGSSRPKSGGSSSPRRPSSGGGRSSGGRGPAGGGGRKR